MAKQKYYDIKALLETEAQYMMLLGQRANGKSYQVKLTVLKNAYKLGYKFIYLRRYREDLKQQLVSRYFDDMPISKITDGIYTGVKAQFGSIYFTYLDKNGKECKGDEIGVYCSLNEYERYKSQVFGEEYKYIVYEEFITDNIYLYDEPRLLQQFVSTVARHRKITVFLVGNTLSRVCPYFSEWCLEGVLNQKQGTIEIYHFHVDDAVIDIAVEYCANIQAQNKMFFGQTAKQIVTGEWDTKDVPKLPRKQEEYECVYELMVVYQKFKFVLQLLVEPKEGGRVVFIYPYTGHREIKRVITNEFSDSVFINSVLDVRKRPEALIMECFKLNKICFSDNMTGSDFRNVNKVFRIAPMLN